MASPFVMFASLVQLGAGQCVSMLEDKNCAGTSENIDLNPGACADTPLRELPLDASVCSLSASTHTTGLACRFPSHDGDLQICFEDPAGSTDPQCELRLSSPNIQNYYKKAGLTHLKITNKHDSGLCGLSVKNLNYCCTPVSDFNSTGSGAMNDVIESIPENNELADKIAGDFVTV